MPDGGAGTAHERTANGRGLPPPAPKGPAWRQPGGANDRLYGAAATAALLTRSFALPASLRPKAGRARPGPPALWRQPTESRRPAA